MKYLLIIFLFPLALQAQQLKTGLWVKVKTELADGARFVDTSVNSKGFVKYNFFDDGGAQIGSDPLFYNFKLKYSLSGDFLTIGFVNYQVEKLTADSLVIHESGVSPSKFRRYYYVKAGSPASCGVPTYNTALKDSVYTANNYLFPQFNGNSSALMSQVNDFTGKGSIRLSFTITKDGRLIDFNILENKTFSKKIISKLTKAFNSQDIEWKAASINDRTVNTAVELVINNGFGKYDVGYSFDYPFIKILK